jgi:hypothetical protein
MVARTAKAVLAIGGRMCPKIIEKRVCYEEFSQYVFFMSWFSRSKTNETLTIPLETPASQLEQLRHARREAKAEFDADWKKLHAYLNTHPPQRRMFFWNGAFFVPVNFLKNVPTEQRVLETRVTRSKTRWNTLQKQETDLEFVLGLKK